MRGSPGCRHTRTGKDGPVDGVWVPGIVGIEAFWRFFPVCDIG
jgi:hypothetical protein